MSIRISAWFVKELKAAFSKGEPTDLIGLHVIRQTRHIVRCIALHKIEGDLDLQRAQLLIFSDCIVSRLRSMTPNVKNSLRPLGLRYREEQMNAAAHIHCEEL